MEGIGCGQRFTSSLISRREIAPGILEVSMAKPKGFAFIPGQFVRIYLDGTPREYTIVSGKDADTIDLCIALVEWGQFSTLITKAPLGGRIQFSGPHGHFIFQESPRRSVFVATGTGIAPFVAFCRGGINGDILLQGVAVQEQLIYNNVLKDCFEKYVPCISNPEPARCNQDGVYAGRVTEYLKSMLVPGVYDFYVCGQRNMVADVTALIDEAFGRSRLFIENYG